MHALTESVTSHYHFRSLSFRVLLDMAAHISSRTLLSKLPTTTKPLAFLMSRSYFSTPIAPLLTNPTSSHSLFRPLAASCPHLGRSFPAIRSLWSRAISNLDNEIHKWPSRPPKVKRLPPGRDFEHWLVRKEEPDPNSTRDEIIDSYVKTLALVIGSVQVARMLIYSVSTKYYYAFGARVPEEVAIKIVELPNIKFVIPDQYVNVNTKEYGGEPFINGQAVPYHPKYHKEQINNSREPEIIRKNPPEDNIPPSGNYEVPSKMGVREWIRHYYLHHMSSGCNLYRLPPNMGGVPQGNYVGMPPPNNLYRLPTNMGGVPQGNYSGMPPPNKAGGMPPPNNLYRLPPNMGAVAQGNYGGFPPPNYAGGMSPPNNAGGMPPPNNTGMTPNAGRSSNTPGK